MSNCKVCDGGCSCHLNAPCGHCVSHSNCDKCDAYTCETHPVTIDGDEVLICSNCLDELAVCSKCLKQTFEYEVVPKDDDEENDLIVCKECLNANTD